MESFTSEPVCPKCRSDRVNFKYNHQDCFDVVCLRCQYTWQMQTAPKSKEGDLNESLGLQKYDF